MSVAKRILILGCPGSGKTTLSITLAKHTGLEVIHLDRYFWKPNWTRSSDDEWPLTVDELSLGAEWIIDGNYISTLEIRLSRADLVIFLDFNRFTCLFSAFFRAVKNRGKQRHDIGEGCPERIDFEFLKYVYSFNKLHRPRMIEALKNLPDEKIIVLKSRRQVNKWINDNYSKST